MNEALTEFVTNGSPDAFRRIVAGHIDGVHAQCARRLRDPSMAEDVTQAVFVMLARHARRVPADAPLAGWLYVTARYACLNAVRAEARRRAHERKAAVMRPEAGADGATRGDADLRASLDDALAKLRAADRDAIVLRYLEGRPMAEVGRELGVSEATARQRVSRAVDRLRRRLESAGMTVPATGLPAMLSGAAAWPAPHGLVDAIVQRALSPSAGPAVELLAKGTWNMMAWTKVRTAAAVTVGVAALAVTVAAIAQAGGQPQPQPRPRADAHAATTAPAVVEVPPRLQGVWVAVDRGIPVTITVEGTTLTFEAQDERTVLDITRVDTTVVPHGIDGRIRENTLRGRRQDLPGTPYELAYMLGDDDLLRLAMSPPGAPRARSVDPAVERKALVLQRKPAADGAGAVGPAQP